MTDQVKEVFQRIQVSRETLIISHQPCVSRAALMWPGWCWSPMTGFLCRQLWTATPRCRSVRDGPHYCWHHDEYSSTEAWCPSCPTRPELLSKKWTRKMISRASGSSLLSLRWPCPVPVNCLHFTDVSAADSPGWHVHSDCPAKQGQRWGGA